MSEDESAYYYYYDYPDYVETAVASGIYVYTAPILLLLGTVGNVLALIIMLHLSQYVWSTCIYLALLAIIDLLVLYTRCGNEWLLNVAQIDLSHQLMVTSSVICKVYPFVFGFIYHTARWLLVATAIEGFIATKYPEKVASMCTRSRAQAVIMFLIVLLVCVNIHYFWSFELVPWSVGDRKEYYCTFAKIGHQHSEEFQQLIWPIMELLVAEVMPYVLVIVCGVTMLKRLIQGTHKGDKAHQRWRQRYELNPVAMDELKITILALCCFYILLTLPRFTFSIYKYIADTSNSMAFATTHEEAQKTLALAICATLEYIFLSLKFVVYFSTSHQFKVEFFKLLRWCTCRCCKLRLSGMRKRLLGDELPCDASMEENHTPAKQSSPDCVHMFSERNHVTSELDHVTLEQHHLLNHVREAANHNANDPYHMTERENHVTSLPHYVTAEPSDTSAVNYYYVTPEPFMGFSNCSTYPKASKKETGYGDDDDMAEEGSDHLQPSYKSLAITTV